MLMTFFLTAIDAITGTGRKEGIYGGKPERKKRMSPAIKPPPSLKKEDLRGARGNKCPAKPQPRQKGNITRPRVLMK